MSIISLALAMPQLVYRDNWAAPPLSLTTIIKEDTLCGFFVSVIVISYSPAAGKDSPEEATSAAVSYTHLDVYKRQDLDDPLSLPLISSDDIVAAGTSVVCLSQSRIKRIVTMMTSGSTAAPKRIYFSEADLELTIDVYKRQL